MAKNLIQPKILKGFSDQLPQSAIPRKRMLKTIEEVFQSFGYAPIETPALEYTEILLGKGSSETDKQLYRFRDQGDRDIALRFDLTVPFARYAATHIQKLGTPFKRYHIAPVWRAEKPQRGRFREFFQCDFDIIGTKSVYADAEIVGIIYKTLSALEINHCIRINNRLLLNGFLESLEEKNPTAILRAIDKLDKLGVEVVEKELETEANLSKDEIAKVFNFINLSKEIAENSEILSELKASHNSGPKTAEGIKQLEVICETLPAYGLDKNSLKIDLNIARGLDYYTGNIFETSLVELPEIGSICSGGRYDNLASLYTKQELPGVGASIGLDRIMAAYAELGKLKEEMSTANVIVCILDSGTENKCIEIASSLRNSRIAVEVYPGVNKLGNQLKYANKKGIRYAIIAGSDELLAGVCNLKDLETGQQIDKIEIHSIASHVN